jgi:hypothetical protein
VFTAYYVKCGLSGKHYQSGNGGTNSGGRTQGINSNSRDRFKDMPNLRISFTV